MTGGQKVIEQKKQAVYEKINLRASRSRAVYRRRCVPLCVKRKSQQHSRVRPRARFISNARNICRLSCGRPEVVHCPTYSIAVRVIEKSRNILEAAPINRIERTIARRACQSTESSLWPQSVPGWQ